MARWTVGREARFRRDARRMRFERGDVVGANARGGGGDRVGRFPDRLVPVHDARDVPTVSNCGGDGEALAPLQLPLRARDGAALRVLERVALSCRGAVGGAHRLALGLPDLPNPQRPQPYSVRGRKYIFHL